MFENKTYKRFDKIRKYFKKQNRIILPFDTKLGIRGVCCVETPCCVKINDNIIARRQGTLLFIYYDYDGSVLFMLSISKDGKIEIIQQKIDEVAIYSAIYEIECLIYGDKQKNKGEILKKLLSYYDNNTNTMGLLRWR